VIKQIRAFLLERGLMFARTPAKLKTAMADILENAEADLTPRMRNLIDGLWSEWKLVERQIEELNDELERISAADAGCTRIRKIPGIGLVVATAIVAAIGKGLRSARGESSQRGLVSSHASTRLVATRGCLASRFCNATKPRQDRKARKFASAQSSISA
jgi:transposase